MKVEALWVAVIIVAGCIAGPADAQEVLYEDGVAEPFATPESIVALKNDILQNDPTGQATLPPSADTILPNIKYWGYRVERRVDGRVTATFIQDFSSQSTINQLRSWISQFRKDGCSFVNVGSPSFSVQDKTIQFSAGLSGKQRTCADIPIVGGQVVNDIADIGGSVSGSLSFAVVPSDAVANFANKVELGQQP